ncbi:hypothetical protein [Streptomyces sp. N35]|uniref:hypothetical protein n=1 Tax=Streptomyces sp. N35 TaxID=2795730 RepID=UPI0018F39BBA|nr:hypothetical protein [Streptomyces sp. N35]
MDLYLVNPHQVKPPPFTSDDWSATLLRCLARPFADEIGSELRGVLFRGEGLLRLYMGSDELSGVVAADVRPGGH